MQKTNLEVFVNDKNILNIKTDNTRESKVNIIVIKAERTASDIPIQEITKLEFSKFASLIFQYNKFISSV